MSLWSEKIVPNLIYMSIYGCIISLQNQQFNSLNAHVMLHASHIGFQTCVVAVRSYILEIMQLPHV